MANPGGQIKATKGTIKAKKTELKAAVQTKDLARIDTIYDAIYAIQADRKDKLTQINGLLGEMAALLQ